MAIAAEVASEAEKRESDAGLGRDQVGGRLLLPLEADVDGDAESGRLLAELAGEVGRGAAAEALEVHVVGGLEGGGHGPEQDRDVGVAVGRMNLLGELQGNSVAVSSAGLNEERGRVLEEDLLGEGEIGAVVREVVQRSLTADVAEGQLVRRAAALPAQLEHQSEERSSLLTVGGDS